MKNKKILIILPVIFSSVFLAMQAGALARSQDGRLFINIHVGPTCPVETNPPNPLCADKQYKGVVSLIKREDASVRTFQTNDGKIRAHLPTGTYLVKAGGTTGYPRCEQKDAKVDPRKITYVDVSCDSGIR